MLIVFNTNSRIWKFKIAKDIDSEYYKNYLKAKKAGLILLHIDVN